MAQHNDALEEARNLLASLDEESPRAGFTLNHTHVAATVAIAEQLGRIADELYALGLFLGKERPR